MGKIGCTTLRRAAILHHLPATSNSASNGDIARQRSLNWGLKNVVTINASITQRQTGSVNNYSLELSPQRLVAFS